MRSTRRLTRAGPRTAVSTVSSTVPAARFPKPRSIFLLRACTCSATPIGSAPRTSRSRTATAGGEVARQEARGDCQRWTPLRRAGSPWDIAEDTVYLAGPSGGFVTGETLTVDGGGQLWGETWTTGKPAYFGGGSE